MRILIVEDDPALARNLIEYLEPDHDVDHAADGRTGLRLAVAGGHDVLVVDWNLPRLDGLELCGAVRKLADGGPPILMLTARDELDDKVAAFEAGVDDYLVKPFALRELAVRIAAVVRRRGAPRAAGDELRVADLRFDPATLRAWRGERELRLTRIGLRILELLLRNAPAVVRRETLQAELWGTQVVSEGVLRTHVYALRKQVDAAGALPLLHTVHGIGYRVGVDP